MRLEGRATVARETPFGDRKSLRQRVGHSTCLKVERKLSDTAVRGSLSALRLGEVACAGAGLACRKGRKP